MRSLALSLERKKKLFLSIDITNEKIFAAIIQITFISLTEVISLEKKEVKKLLNILQLGSVITVIIFLAEKILLKLT